ncbi:MAG: NAD(P)H-binding protein [Labilithrix sp.]|nr:NAD(P)H-binding protein [Labilithrix sp.]
MSRTALVVGATGLVGGHVVDQLLARDDRRVAVLVRRSLGKKSARLEEHVTDFDALVESAELDASVGEVDDVFVCLGTTIKIAGSQERFRRVDHDYVVASARAARAAGAKRLALVSSVGADAGASTFYLRVKGETERDVRDLGFETLILARPSFLVGEREQERFGERAGIAVASAFGWAMIGGLGKYRPIEARRVAAAMIRAIDGGASGEAVLSYPELSAAEP